MAITGTITIPEQSINYTDVTGLAIQKGGKVHVYTNSGVSIYCSFTDFWGALSAQQKTGITGLIDLVATLSDISASTNGEF